MTGRQVYRLWRDGGDVSCQVLADLGIEQGRRKPTDGAAPSKATFIIDRGKAAGIEVGVPVRITSTDGADRFTGTVTDVDASQAWAGHDAPARLAVTAMGRLADLGHTFVGDTPWPQETVRARVLRVMALVPHMAHIVQGGSNGTILPRDIDRQPVLTLLEGLAEQVGAAVVDRPDGRIVWQGYDARTAAWGYQRWVDLPQELTWAAWDEDTWRGMDTIVEYSTTLPLPACAVLWAPTWDQTQGEVINRVRLRWGADTRQQAEVLVENPASQTRFGVREVSLSTVLALANEAENRAQDILTRHAWPVWDISDVTVDLHRCTPTQRADLFSLQVGHRVTVPMLPASSPLPGSEWTGLVEGWTESYDPDRWELRLRLSDRDRWRVTLTWGLLPVGQRWEDLDAGLTWSEWTSASYIAERSEEAVVAA